MSIEYESRFEDRLAAVDVLFEIERFEPLIRKMKRWAVVKGLIVMILSGALILFLVNLRGRSLSMVGYIFMLTPSVLLGVWWIHRFLLTPIVRSQVWRVGYDSCRALSGPGIDGINRIEITDSGLVGIDDWQRGEMFWPCIRKIERGPVVSCLQILDTRWILIPRRCFDSEDAYRWFVDEIEARNNAAGGVSGLIVRHLAAYELRCAKCRYELHKNTEAICPECGRPVELSDFRSHTTDRVDRKN